jgi:predicted dehydrogenase
MTVTSPQTLATDPDASPARRFAVLGLGRLGLAYAMSASRLEGCTLAGLADPRAPARRFARAAGFGAPSAPALDRLLARAPADAVVVAVPGPGRAEAVEAALDTGLAVLVDGLPALDGPGAARLATRIAAASTPVGCAAGPRFHPLFARAARLLGAGAIGAPRDVRASVYVSRVFAADTPPEQGDVLDFALADLLVLIDVLFGRTTGVEATAGRLYGPRIDEVHARLRLADGLEAGIDGSWSVPGYPRASLVVEVRANRGALLVSDDALECDLAEPFEDLPAGHHRRVLAEEPDDVTFEAGEPARALAAFARMLAGRPLPSTLDPAPALRAAATLDAIRHSIAEGGMHEVGG